MTFITFCTQTLQIWEEEKVFMISLSLPCTSLEPLYPINNCQLFKTKSFHTSWRPKSKIIFICTRFYMKRIHILLFLYITLLDYQRSYLTLFIFCSCRFCHCYRWPPQFLGHIIWAMGDCSSLISSLIKLTWLLAYICILVGDKFIKNWLVTHMVWWTLPEKAVSRFTLN